MAIEYGLIAGLIASDHRALTVTGTSPDTSSRVFGSAQGSPARAGAEAPSLRAGGTTAPQSDSDSSAASLPGAQAPRKAGGVPSAGEIRGSRRECGASAIEFAIVFRCLGLIYIIVTTACCRASTRSPKREGICAPTVACDPDDAIPITTPTRRASPMRARRLRRRRSIRCPLFAQPDPRRRKRPGAGHVRDRRGRGKTVMGR